MTRPYEKESSYALKQTMREAFNEAQEHTKESNRLFLIDTEECREYAWKAQACHDQIRDIKEELNLRKEARDQQIANQEARRLARAKRPGNKDKERQPAPAVIPLVEDHAIRQDPPISTKVGASPPTAPSPKPPAHRPEQAAQPDALKPRTPRMLGQLDAALDKWFRDANLTEPPEAMSHWSILIWKSYGFVFLGKYSQQTRRLQVWKEVSPYQASSNEETLEFEGKLWRRHS